MNINDLTIGQARELIETFSSGDKSVGLNVMVGKKCIIRTYSAGVWFGTVAEKSGSEVIVAGARRMWKWWAADSISLSGVARYGIKQEKSKIAPAVNSVWLDAIEIIPATLVAITSIEGAPDATIE